MKKTLIFYVLSSLFLASCSVLLYGRYGRVPLTGKREDFEANNLKTDGFYHFRNGKYFMNMLYFKNGITLTPYGTPYSKKEDKVETENYFKTITKENNPYYDVVYAWGIFKVENNILTMEGWLSGDGGKYQSAIFHGQILNDTTFVLNNRPTTTNGVPFELSEMEKRHLKPPYQRLDTFRFVKTSVKPDSTCPFITY